MAFWVLGGGGPPDIPNTFPQQHQRHLHYEDDVPYVYRSKRPVEHHYDEHSHHELRGSAGYDSDGAMKRARMDDWAHRQRYDHEDRGVENPMPLKSLAFYVIREGSHSTPPEHIHKRPRPISPDLVPAANFTATSMERTASGLSISSEPATYNSAEDHCDSSLGDLEAASFVLRNISSSHSNSQPSRILHSLIYPGPHEKAFELDNNALTSLFHAANGLFFGRKLSNRVTWDWTSAKDGDPRYDGHIIGTTALRQSKALGGFETLIVLSSPILKDTRYNRRLLIATFLHEMIHSYLFITCGMKAGRQGGHTEGFRRIAKGIDEWVGGRDILRLGEVEADLGSFCEKGHHHHHGDFGHQDARYGGWQWYGQEDFGRRLVDDRGWHNAHA